MATRSRIAIEHKDGIVDSIYCHWDGYPENNGRLLHEHYLDREKVEALIALGDISFLAPNVEPDPDGDHTFTNPQDGVVVAYHRDRGEPRKSRAASQCTSREKFLKGDIEEFGYLFTKNGEWVYVSDDDRNPRTCANIRA